MGVPRMLRGTDRIPTRRSTRRAPLARAFRSDISESEIYIVLNENVLHIGDEDVADDGNFWN